MATKGSGNVTVTLARTTVAMLRAKKKDLETWDDLMHRLGRIRPFAIECVFCGTSIETTNGNITPAMLAKANGWGRVARVSDEEEARTKEELGYICPNCLEKYGKCKGC